MRYSSSVAAAAALLLAGCAGSVAEPSAATGPLLAATPLGNNGFPLTTRSAIDAPERLVIRDAATWQAQWNAIWAGLTPTPALPPVDFTREMVVVAAMGTRATGGYTIRIDSAAAAAGVTPGGGAVVWVTSASPGPHCFTTQALTHPVDAVRLPLVGGPVTFREQSQTVDCP